MPRLSRVDTSAIDAVLAKLGRAANVSYEDIKPLLEESERILIEGNRKGVLSQQGGHGQRLPDVTYRGSFSKTTYARRGQKFGSASGTFKGRKFGGIASGDPHAHGNLTTAEYRRLTGPPLAPRGEQSRVITNCVTSSGQDGSGRFFVKRGWKQVLDRRGRPFLKYAFRKRDLRGVRPWEREQIRKATRVWVKYFLSRK